MKTVVKPAIVSLVQQLPFVVAVAFQCRRIGWGCQVSLIEVAIGPSIRGLRAETTTRPDVPHSALAAGHFAQQDGSGWIANHRSWITLCPPIGGRITRGPVNSDTMAARQRQVRQGIRPLLRVNLVIHR